MLDECWREVRKVLLVRLDNLGDVLVTTPAFHAVRNSLPYAELTLLTSPVGAQVGRLNPDLHEIIVYEAPWMDPWRQLPQDSAREQHMITLLRERHFDGAIIFTSFRQSALPAAYLCYLADIPLRAAASIDGPGSLLTTRHRHPNHFLHEVERGIDLVESLGMQSESPEMVLRVPEEAKVTIRRLLTQQECTRNRPLLIVHPGCSMPARTYPGELYAQAIELLIQDLDACVCLTGTSQERALIDSIIKRVNSKYHRYLLSFVDALSFPELCALLENANLVITNNTGPMHMAAALKTPIVVLFALTNPPEQWGPWRVPHKLLYHEVACRLCYSRVCPHHQECLRLISPHHVVEASRVLLNESMLLLGKRRGAS